MRQGFIILVVLSVAMASAHASGPEDILGVWMTEDRDANIEIYTCGEKYCGKIVWLEQPTYPPGSKEGKPGDVVLDHNNPKPELRNNPLIGLQMLFDFEFEGNNVWSKGKIYDPDNGKTYGGKLRILSAHQLEVRGFMGVSLFGRTTTWTKQQP